MSQYNPFASPGRQGRPDNPLSGHQNSVALPTLAYRDVLRDWQTVRWHLDFGAGFLRIQSFPISDDEAQTSSLFEALVSRLGRVTPHGASRQTTWRVSPRATLDHEPTFSEAASEAPLHTDNSWVERPEKYFALLVIRPAAIGGNSLLFSVDDLLSDFANEPRGPEALRVLERREFPFAMPVVFRSDADHQSLRTPLVTSPVISGPDRFRFRYDVIQTGFRLRPDLATPDRVEAIELFHEFLTRRLESAQGVRLERGECLLANNHTVLHARDHFTDANRLLLRARIAEE